MGVIQQFEIKIVIRYYKTEVIVFYFLSVIAYNPVYIINSQAVLSLSALRYKTNEGGGGGGGNSSDQR